MAKEMKHTIENLERFSKVFKFADSSSLEEHGIKDEFKQCQEKHTSVART